ncbi:MAG: hypothetical protein U0V70_04200 [Terriglobia bacterium]
MAKELGKAQPRPLNPTTAIAAHEVHVSHQKQTQEKAHTMMNVFLILCSGSRY